MHSKHSRKFDYRKLNIFNYYDYTASTGHCSNHMMNKLMKGTSKKQCYDQMLLWACEIGNLNTCKYLISLNADIDIINQGLTLACKYDHTQIVEYLMSINANINNKSLSVALANNNYDIVKYLVNDNSNIQEINDDLLNKANLLINMHISEDK